MSDETTFLLVGQLISALLNLTAIALLPVFIAAFLLRTTYLWLCIVNKYIKRCVLGQYAVKVHKGIPMFGCMVEYGTKPQQLLQRLKAQHGPIFGINLAGKIIYIVSDSAAIYQYHKAREDVLNADKANSAFGFKKKASKLIPTMNRQVVLFQLNKNLENHASIYAKIHSKYLSQYISEQSSETFDVHDAYKYAGYRSFVAALLPLSHGILASTFMDNMVNQSKLKGKAIMKTVLLGPFFAMYDWNKVNSARQSLVDQLKPFVYEELTILIQEKIADYDVQFFKDHHEGILHDYAADGKNKSFIFYCIMWHVKQKKTSMLTISKLAEYTLDIIFGGQENPSTAAVETILFLYEHPDCLRQLKDEIAHFGVNKSNILQKVEGGTIREMNYLQCCIKETFRKLTHPIGSMRYSLCDTSLKLSNNKEYFIPKNTFIGVSPHLRAYNDAVFENPQSYNPARFQEPLSEYKKEMFSWIPFSGGRHMCPGQQLSQTVIAGAVLQHFVGEQIKPVKDYQCKGQTEVYQFSDLTWKKSASLARRGSRVYFSVV